MTADLDVVTGAFSYTGAFIARHLRAVAGEPTGTEHFSEGIGQHGSDLGTRDATELTRHFREMEIPLTSAIPIR